jgi:AGZA family xanthine/uracil permease-like MFS transporter
MALFPNLARVVEIQMGYAAKFADMVKELATRTEQFLNADLVTIALGNGFILTSMLWGAWVALLIDRKLRQAAVYLVILAGLAFFGVIHSVYPDGNMYLPWNIPEPFLRAIPYQFSSGYLALAALFFGLSFTRESAEPRPEE